MLARSLNTLLQIAYGVWRIQEVLMRADAYQGIRVISHQPKHRSLR